MIARFASWQLAGRWIADHIHIQSWTNQNNRRKIETILNAFVFKLEIRNVLLLNNIKSFFKAKGRYFESWELQNKTRNAIG